MERPVTHDFALSPLPALTPGAATASWHLLLAGLPFSDTTRLQTLMRGYGHRVSVVHGLAQVQARLADDEIDVLLHGSEHLAQLESMSRLPSRPARICLVDGTDARSRIEALDAGADDCLSRPYAPRELLARVAAVLRRRGSSSTAFPLPANDVGEIIATHQDQPLAERTALPWLQAATRDSASASSSACARSTPNRPTAIARESVTVRSRR